MLQCEDFEGPQFDSSLKSQPTALFHLRNEPTIRLIKGEITIVTRELSKALIVTD